MPKPDLPENLLKRFEFDSSSQEFEQGLDYPQPTHLLRSLLSTLLEGLLDKPVDTSDQALVSALKIVLLAQAEDKFDGSECPTVEEIGFPRPAGSTSTATPIDEESGEATAVQQPEPPEPLPGTTQTANLWTLPTHKKAALFRYLAEWSLEMNDKVRDYIDKIYENRDSDKNDLSVLRVGKDRNRNLFWMLKGFPRMWRETVAGKWSELLAGWPWFCAGLSREADSVGAIHRPDCRLAKRLAQVCRDIDGRQACSRKGFEEKDFERDCAGCRGKRKGGVWI